MTRHAVTLATLVLCATACSNSAQPKSAPQTTGPQSSAPAGESDSHPVGSKLVRDADASEHKFEIGKNDAEGGLGKYSLRLDGKYIWPPTGEGCSTLVACCNEFSKSDKFALVCLLAIGRDGVCTTALDTVNAIAKEQGVSPPASCSR